MSTELPEGVRDISNMPLGGFFAATLSSAKGLSELKAPIPMGDTVTPRHGISPTLLERSCDSNNSLCEFVLD